MKYLTITCLLLFSVALQAQTVFKTPTGEKYHLGNCRMVKNVSQKIKFEDAIKIGLTACKICSPPTSIRSNIHQVKSAQGESKTVQCKGKTKAGARCKHKSSIANGFCFQHNPDD